MTGRIDWLLKLWPFTTMKIRQSWNKILPNPKNALKLPKTFYAYTKDYVVGLNPFGSIEEKRSNGTRTILNPITHLLVQR